MTANLEIKACESAADRRLFEETGELLHGDEPLFPPPFPGHVAKFLDPEGYFHRAHGCIRGFLALRDGAPAGRVAAIVNATHNAYHGDRAGFFGFFECADDAGVAGALFGAAEEWLAAQGCDRMRGPYNPTINDDCGVLVEGFDHHPTVGIPWNPPFYPRLLERCGLSRVREMRAFLLDRQAPLPELVRKVHARIARRGRFTLRNLRMRHLEEELEKLRVLYNSTLDRNWGFVPISFLDLVQSAGELRAVANPEIIQFVEDRGRPAGFVVSLPNFAEILLDAKRVPRPLRLLYILWKIKAHRFRSTRLSVLGVAPEFRDRGITGWLFGEQKLRHGTKYRCCEISWVEANNEEILRNAEMMGCVPTKKLAIYEKPLRAEKNFLRPV